MTLMTLIIASAIFVGIGLSGTKGIVASMVIGGVVCTALSMAGGFVTDLKVGYWLGSTPRKQESWKFLGTLVAAATVGGVILVLNKVYGFSGENALVAPQANAMANVIEPLMMGATLPGYSISWARCSRFCSTGSACRRWRSVSACLFRCP